MTKRNDRLILLMLMLPLAVVLIAAGCKKKAEQTEITGSTVTTAEITVTDSTLPSESETVSESDDPAYTETEAPEETTEESSSQTPTPKPTKKTTATTKKKTGSKKYSKYLFVGDSRTVGLDKYVSGISSIAKVGAGYDYLKKNFKKVTKTRGKNVIINFGVNDLGNINKYITLYKTMPKDFINNNNVVIMSVNPTNGKYKSMNSDINKFNKKLKANLPKGVKYLDTNSKLKKDGFKTTDGLHYKESTYKKIAKLTFTFCGDKKKKV